MRKKYYVAPGPDGTYEVWITTKDGDLDELKRTVQFAYGPYQTQKEADGVANRMNAHTAQQVLLSITERQVRVGLIYNRGGRHAV